MRSGTGISSGSAASPQQTLSPEAASALKQSLTLARRRGHAQVTPLHVAVTLLTSRTSSLLRRACLNSQPHPSQHSHPLQCRALELCFNVALNRLPATPGPLLHSHQPTLSNALVAALKRAQAHQRRGCIEQQQQQQLQHPVVAVRVEIEQLVLSILDDPSVSRVMREAGFSSTAVKDKLEDCGGGSSYSSSVASSVFYGVGGAIGTHHHHHHHGGGGIYSNPSSPPGERQRPLQNPNSSSFFVQSANLFLSPYNNNKKVTVPSSVGLYDQDVRVVLDVMALGKRGRRNVVVVSDSSCMIEGIVGEVMGRVERGTGAGAGSDHRVVPEEIRSAHFIKFQFSSVPLRFMKREEVEMNVADLKKKVDCFVGTGKSVVIYTGDLKWTVDHESGGSGGGGGGEEEASTDAVDHLVAEMGKLVSWYSNNGSSSSRVWLMATASYQTYMKCQMKQPPLDVQWGLQAVNVPSGGLGLSLNANAAPTSGQDSRTKMSQSQSQVVDNVTEEEDVLTCCPQCQSSYDKEADFKKSFSLLSINKDAENGSSAHLPYWLKPQGIETTDKIQDDLTQLKRKYNTLCQSLHQGTSHKLNNSSSIISNPCYLARNYNHYPSSYSCWPNKNTTMSETISFAQSASSVPMFRRQQSCHIEFSFSNGSSKNQSPEPNLDSLKGIDDKEVKITLALGNSMYNDGPTSEKTALENSLCDILQENVPWQSETIPFIVEALTGSKEANRDKFLLIQGNDFVGKRRLAIGIAKAMFGSSDLLFCMNMRKNTGTVSENREILEKALRDYQKLVVVVEDVDCADPEFVKFLVDGFENDKLKTPDFAHVIFVLTADGDFGCNKTKENNNYVIEMKLIVNQSAFGSGMPSIDHKRKAEWDTPIRSRSHRFTEMEEVSSNVVTNNTIREFTSSNALDLNIKADESEAKEGKSPISSDLTREDTIVQRNSLQFLEKIKNTFVLKRNSDQEERARDMFLNKFKKSYKEIIGNKNIGRFSIEEVLLEEVLQGSGLYLNGMFDQWLKDVFETSLRVVDSGERENVSVRLCLGGKGESCGKDGFMGTCLPKRIQVSFIG